MIISTTASRVRSCKPASQPGGNPARPQTQNPAQGRTDNPSQTIPRPEHKPRTHRPRTPPQNNRNQGRGMYHPQDDLSLVPSTRTSPNQPRTEPNLTLPTVLDNARGRRLTPTPHLGQTESIGAGRTRIDPLINSYGVNDLTLATRWKIENVTGVFFKTLKHWRQSE